MNEIKLDDKPEIIVGMIAKSLMHIEENMREKEYDVAHFNIIRLQESVGKMFDRMGGVDAIKSYLNEEISKK